jgi:hypothetical protein
VFSRTSDYLTYGDTSEAETEHKRTTHAPSFLMTPKVLSKLFDSRSFKICKLLTLEAPIPPAASILILWFGSFKLMGLFNIEVLVQQCGWKCSNIKGIVVDFLG